MKGCGKSEVWTFLKNNNFEIALARLDLKSPDWLERLALSFPTKTIDQLRDHYLDLVADIDRIDSGLFDAEEVEQVVETTRITPPPPVPPPPVPPHAAAAVVPPHAAPAAAAAKRKRMNWLFLMGLSAHGRGGWRHISKYFIISTTPIQVASHAQKYFNRSRDFYKRTGRSSIQDIRNIGEPPFHSTEAKSIFNVVDWWKTTFDVNTQQECQCSISKCGSKFPTEAFQFTSSTLKAREATYASSWQTIHGNKHRPKRTFE
ncbi:hypothetical protein Cni_G03498 [Canna indica]|uniref:MYB transcription factor n=1 Tax=Canna indica TaxID=4628 RepID=A0AAQ3Q1U2_9LILI|nr:hypothetical protein Cni_G03498 [Canna indica]